MVISADLLASFGDGDAERGRRELRMLLANSKDKARAFSGTVEKPTSVRIANPVDEDAILELLLLDLRANAEHIAPIDPEKVMEHIRAGTRRRGGITAVIDGPEKQPVAVCIIHPFQWWWSQGWYWFEIVLFVHPDHRKSRHMDDLLQFEKWCSQEQSRKMGNPFYLLCGVLGAWRIQSKIAAYRRRFQQAGAAFVFPAPPVREG